jgi:hypothetical protein
MEVERRAGGRMRGRRPRNSPRSDRARKREGGKRLGSEAQARTFMNDQKGSECEGLQGVAPPWGAGD